MNILEFINTQYPIKDRVVDKLSNPYKLIMEMNDLPYDVIGPDENGVITKLVEVDDCSYIPVLDLISYTREDIVGMNNEQLLSVWDAYMSQIDVTDLNIIDIMESASKYQQLSGKRKDILNVLSS